MPLQIKRKILYYILSIENIVNFSIDVHVFQINSLVKLTKLEIFKKIKKN